MCLVGTRASPPPSRRREDIFFFFCSAILPRKEAPSRETGPVFRPRETRPIFVSRFEDKHEDEVSDCFTGSGIYPPYVPFNFRRLPARSERNRDVSLLCLLY